MPPQEAYFSRLTEDLVARILVLLPLRQVARARLVCRRWHALTTDHHFVRTSFSRGRPIPRFFFYQHWGVGRRDSFPRYFPLDREADKEVVAAGDRLDPDLSFILGTGSADLGRDGLYIEDSCNGLLLLERGLDYYVCNPLTKKLVPIVQPRDSPICVNLAFDPSKSRHYKIIALVGLYSVHVYSSETRSWQMAIHSDHSAGLFRGLCTTRGIFWNGSVVWIVAEDSLVRFIIEGEHITKMPMPPRKIDWICAYIGESGGHLQMVGYTKEEKLTACFDVLEMQEDQSEWSVLFRVDLSRVKELYPDIEVPTWDSRHHRYKIGNLDLSPIYVIRGTGKTGQHGVVIFSIPGKVMSYTMEDQNISMVKEITGPDTSEEYFCLCDDKAKLTKMWLVMVEIEVLVEFKTSNALQPTRLFLIKGGNDVTQIHFQPVVLELWNHGFPPTKLWSTM